MIPIEIDGKTIQAEPGSTIIEAADKHNIYIPRYCYHKKLSIAANCRMCLVEIEKAPKPMPACATPVTAGMKIYTTSKIAVEAQRNVMEFLLINHPLDCPVCDQGGECELQDLAMGYGRSLSYFHEKKRAVFNEDIGPLIDVEMTRCIHCTRCVRFGEEVAGMRELGLTFRGENAKIGTYVKHMMQSELSGNIIDLCPVGALTAKPSRYSSRSWELREHLSIAPHDCVGSNIFIHTRGHQYKPQRTVMRVVPRENDAVNEIWISDRDRFSYQGLSHPSRLQKPRMKHKGSWVEVDWQRALIEIADRTEAIVIEQGADELAAIVSPNATTEECYLMQKMLRALGSNHIDHRIREQDFSDQDFSFRFTPLGMKLTDIESLDAILLVGAYPRHDQPLINHRIYKAVQEGGAVMVIHQKDYTFNYPLAEKIIHKKMIEALAQVAKALAPDDGIPEALLNIKPSESAKSIAQRLKQANNLGIFMGTQAMSHSQAGQIRALIQYIVEQTGGAEQTEETEQQTEGKRSRWGVLSSGANSTGAALAGAVPHHGAAGAPSNDPGLNAQQLFSTDPRRAYFLLNVEPEFDCASPASALTVLKNAGLVVCLTPFVSDTMLDYADFVLPIASFAETAGTFVNIEGQWQSFAAATLPEVDSKPAWKVLRVLANLMELEGFHFRTVHQVRDELKKQIINPSIGQRKNLILAMYSPLSRLGRVIERGEGLLPDIQPIMEESGLSRLAPWPMFRSDSLVRRALALQDTLKAQLVTIQVNQATADKLSLVAGQAVIAKQADSQIVLPLSINNALADDVVLLFSGLEETAGFGSIEQSIELESADV